MKNRPTPRRSYALTARLDRALTLLDRIIALIEQGEPSVPDASTWDAMTSRVTGWNDPEVRAAIISLYGRSSTRKAVNLLAAEFGSERIPTKSALARLHIQMARHEISVGHDLKATTQQTGPSPED